MRAFLILLPILLIMACNNSGKKQDGPDTTVQQIPDPADSITSTDTIFRGTGTEPFWSVYVIRDNKILFHPAEGPDIVVPFVQATSMDSTNIRYTSTNDSTTLELSITKRDCSDGMSDITYPFAVTIAINAVKYEGCGR